MKHQFLLISIKIWLLTEVSGSSWSEWSVWSKCDQDCDDGYQTSARICENDDGSQSGTCEGESTKKQICNVKPCIVVTCEIESMCIQLNMPHLMKNGIPNDYELNLKGCDPKNHREIMNEDVKLCTELGIDKCGGQMEMNNTHINYKNNVLASKIKVPGEVIWNNIVSEQYLIPWLCSYPLEYLISPSTKTENDEISTFSFFIPKISEVVETQQVTRTLPGLNPLSISGTGSFPVAMMLYKTDEYNTVWDRPPTLEVETRLHIQTHLLTGPEEATVQTRRCWATSTKNPNDEIKFVVIDNFCPVDNAVDQAAVELLKNGLDFASRWETNVFKFVGEDNIFMHCLIRLCFKSETSQCDVFDCNKTTRKRRDTTEKRQNDKDTMVSLGPLTMDTDVVEINFGKEIKKEGQIQLSAEAIALIFLIFTIIVVFICWIFRTKKKNNKQNS